MTETKHTALASDTKILVGIVGALAVANLLGFIFYQYKIHYLLTFLGFGLIAYGTLKNGVRKRPKVETDSAGLYASICGLLLASLSIVLGYLQ